MLRAAAKNHAAVLVVVDPADYDPLLAELDAHGGGSEFATRARLAAKAFAHTAGYDTMVAAYLAARHPDAPPQFPATLPLSYQKVQDLRYGENPHQRAAFYRDAGARGAGIANARVLQGKELSFNNIADADTAIECVGSSHPACVIVKAPNPAASPPPPRCAKPTGAPAAPTHVGHGGIIAVNRELNARAAAILGRQFVECLAAPSMIRCGTRALAARPNVRVLGLGDLAPGRRSSCAAAADCCCRRATWPISRARAHGADAP
jgi:phosphoribosylaminoimidazolecarboxamide formyltransferase/IMP cyclohydrolase